MEDINSFIDFLESNKLKAIYNINQSAYYNLEDNKVFTDNLSGLLIIDELTKQTLKYKNEDCFFSNIMLLDIKGCFERINKIIDKDIARSVFTTERQK